MHNNLQAPEKLVLDFSGAMLDVHTIFGPTIQGEGPYAGRPAFFVRLAGCNLQCPGCDTDYTNGRTRMDVMGIVADLKKMRLNHPKVDLVVVTGGEPFRQNIAHLVDTLWLNEFTIQIETNGSLAPRPNAIGHTFPFNRVTIVCSPKTGAVAGALRPHIAAYKYVVSGPSGAYSPDDGLPLRALRHPSAPQLARPHPGFEGTVYIQPEDQGDESTNADNLHHAVHIAFKHGYTLGLQLHKILHLD